MLGAEDWIFRLFCHRQDGGVGPGEYALALWGLERHLILRTRTRRSKEQVLKMVPRRLRRLVGGLLLVSGKQDG